MNIVGAHVGALCIVAPGTIRVVPNRRSSVLDGDPGFRRGDDQKVVIPAKAGIHVSQLLRVR
jgi:hypothetical protein